jgi:hypothetical protein
MLLVFFVILIPVMNWRRRQSKLDLNGQEEKLKKVQVEQRSQGGSRSGPPSIDVGELDEGQQQGQHQRTEARHVVRIARGSHQEARFTSWDRRRRQHTSILPVGQKARVDQEGSYL